MNLSEIIQPSLQQMVELVRNSDNIENAQQLEMFAETTRLYTDNKIRELEKENPEYEFSQFYDDDLISIDPEYLESLEPTDRQYTSLRVAGFKAKDLLYGLRKCRMFDFDRAFINRMVEKYGKDEIFNDSCYWDWEKENLEDEINKILRPLLISGFEG